MRKIYLLFFISLTIAACSDDKKIPKNILPKQKMQDVLWDMISAGEYLNGYVITLQDSVDKSLESAKKYGQVLQFHHITQEQFEKSYQYYRDHPVLMKVILDSLSKRQIPPEELYKPKPTTDSSAATHPDSLAKRHTDSLLKQHTDSLLKKHMDSVRTRIRKPGIVKRDSLKKRRILKKLSS
jgi:hypothetical protein